MSTCAPDQPSGTLVGNPRTHTWRKPCAHASAITIIGILAAAGARRRTGGRRGHGCPSATLTGSATFPAVNGKAKFQRDDGVRQLEAQIEDAKPLAGQR